MREISDGMKLTLFVVAILVTGCLLAFIMVSSVKASRRLQIREWRSNGSTIIVNGESINPQDIQEYSQNGSGVIVLTIKNGQRIESSNWTIITPAPSVEKQHDQ